MKNIYMRTMMLALLGFFFPIPARAIDAKVRDALTAAGAKIGAIREGGTHVDIPGEKLNDEVWKLLETVGDLKSFSSSGKQFDDVALSRLAKITSIESVFINGSGITDKGLPALGSFPNLHKFGADHGQLITGAGLAGLSGAKNLTALSFGGCMFNDKGMEALGNLTQLRDVRLNHDRLTSAGFSNLAKLTQLEKLRISPNNSPYYVGSDLKALSGLKNLTDLSISQMVIGYDDGLDHLKPLHQLKELKLDACAITEADLAKLKTDLPATHIDFTPAPTEIVKKWNDALAKKHAAK